MVSAANKGPLFSDFDGAAGIANVASSAPSRARAASSVASDAPLLAAVIDRSMPLCQQAERIQWQAFESAMGTYFRHGGKRYPIRLLVSLVYLRQMFLLTDAQLLAAWPQNPYWQFFSGQARFVNNAPVTVEVLSAFRTTLSPKFAELFNRQAHTAGILQTIQPNLFADSSPAKPARAPWYKDYAFYVAMLLAVAFWVIWALVGTAHWPRAPLSGAQWKLFFYFVIASPVIEEVVFRHFLQGYWSYFYWGRKRIFGRTVGITRANALTAALFTLAHLFIHPASPITYGIIIPALLFGYFRDRHGHIYASIALHMFYNAGAFMLFVLPTL